MSPESPTIEDIAHAYIKYCHKNDGAYEWSSSATIDIWLDARWPDLWDLVKTISLTLYDIDDQTLALIAAGPLEDLLAKAGPTYIDQVIAEAKLNPRLAVMLTGVWRNSMEADVWEKVVNFCRKVPNPIGGKYAF